MANAFLSGVLAVVIASPCTAPFMGASLGFAIGLPAAQALLMFAVLGFGLALPYLAASFVPAVARLLPRPGPWMDTLRRLLAFPMFATVAWLVWVLGQQSGIDGAGALLALLVAWRRWSGRCTLRGRTRVVVASVADRLHRGAGGRHRRQRGAQRGAHRGRGGRRALAALVAARVTELRRGRPAGVRRLHGRLVRDLPVQQAAARWPTRTCWPTSTPSRSPCCAPTGRGATPPSPPR